MTTQDLINTLRQGAPVTARQVKAIVSQLERIPAMERTLAAKDSDFAQQSVAYSSALKATDRLKKAVRAMLRAQAQGVNVYTAARKAVEKLL